MNNHKETKKSVNAIKKTFTNPKLAWLFVGAALVSESALAFSVPAASAPGYDLYTLVVTNGLQGVPGFVGGAWLIAQAGQMMKESVWKAGLQAAGGAAIIKSDTVLPTLGALIQNVV